MFRVSYYVVLRSGSSSSVNAQPLTSPRSGHLLDSGLQSLASLVLGEM